MNKLDKEFFSCICGHVKAYHTKHYDYPLCEICANDGWGNDYNHEFKLDGLKYLEQCYNERSK